MTVESPCYKERVLVELQRSRGAKFVTLHSRLGVGRATLYRFFKNNPDA